MFFNNMYQARDITTAVNTSSNNLVYAFVQGIEGAKAFQLTPNQRAILFDNDNDCFYIKTTDIYGMYYPLEIFDYTKRIPDNSPSKTNTNEYVTKDEVIAIIQDTLRGKSDGESSDE